MFRLILVACCLLLSLPLQLAAAHHHKVSHEEALLHHAQPTQPKKILIINPWFVGAGMGTALVSMINTFPDPTTQIDLCITREGGRPFAPLLNKKAHIITCQEAQQNIYDTVICYAQWMYPGEWVNKFQGKKKILWIHGDTSTGNWVAHLQHDRSLTAKIDAFVCVSTIAAERFNQALPQYTKKTHVIYNIVDNARIKRESRRKQTDMVKKDSLPIVLTVSRLAGDKGLDESIEAHSILEKEGVHFLWYVIGKGARRPILEDLIKKYHMEDKFILLGFKSNPYCYMKDADIVALFSKAEGFCLVVAEAKILQRPIIVSDFKTAFEQIKSGKNGLIVENNMTAICNGLRDLIQNKAKRDKFSKALEGFECDNTQSFKTIQDVLLK